MRCFIITRSGSEKELSGLALERAVETAGSPEWARFLVKRGFISNRCW